MKKWQSEWMIYESFLFICRIFYKTWVFHLFVQIRADSDARRTIRLLFVGNREQILHCNSAGSVVECRTFFRFSMSLPHPLWNVIFSWSYPIWADNITVREEEEEHKRIMMQANRRMMMVHMYEVFVVLCETWLC